MIRRVGRMDAPCPLFTVGGGQQMLYRVLASRILFRDAMGRSNRAWKTQVVNIELRHEAKRLVAANEIEAVQEAIPEPFTEDEMMAAREAQEPAEPEVGGIAQAKINGKTLVGEILAIGDDGKIKIAFEGDDKSFRKLTPEDVEVIG